MEGCPQRILASPHRHYLCFDQSIYQRAKRSSGFAGDCRAYQSQANGSSLECGALPEIKLFNSWIAAITIFHICWDYRNYEMIFPRGFSPDAFTVFMQIVSGLRTDDRRAMSGGEWEIWDQGQGNHWRGDPNARLLERWLFFDNDVVKTFRCL
jgi:hypothetical protein